MNLVVQAQANAPLSTVRKVLWLDAASSFGAAVLLLLFAGPLQPLLGLDAQLLRVVGALFLPFVACVAWVAASDRTPRVALGWIVVLNALWVVLCLAVLALAWLQPTALGTLFIVGQALFVGAMAAGQFIGLRRLSPDAWAS